jgi:hypothetical protein
MNPIYKFELSAGDAKQQAYPLYKDDLAKDYEKESNQEFFRAKLSGKLTFQQKDYTFIVSKAFDTQFGLEIFISYDGGQSWASYWRGNFWKTDCEFNEDDQTAIVTPSVNDRYSAVLAGMEKEYNLIDLAPEIVPVKADKRPMVQVYVPGQTVIGCFLSGMWWEQECEAVTDETKLVNDYYFALSKSLFVVDVSGGGSITLPRIFTGESFDPTKSGTREYTNEGYTFRYANYVQSGGSGIVWSIIRNSDSKTLWSRTMVNDVSPQLPYEMVLNPVSGSGATGTVTLYLHTISVYSRLICDTQTIVTGSSTLNTYEIPADDIVENNRNYTRVIGYSFPDTIVFSTILVATPTKWGIYQPGQYYFNPADNVLLGLGEAFPVARSAWGLVSIWFVFSVVDWLVESSARRTITIRDAYPLSSVISVLLAKIAPGITHEGTTDYSQFLYDDTNPITGIKQRLLIVPKSNVISSSYDQPAQKAPITLKCITDMLRDCFRCYWFIDEQNRFRIEHISYFMRGGTYQQGQPNIGIDLTQQIVTRNGKPWAYARNQYEFNKPEMAARYQFGWMDDVTELFNGYPIDIISNYVNPGNIEQIDVSQFTSDVDYILLNPSEISKDGFVLLAGTNENYLEEPIEKSGTPTSAIVFTEIDLRQFLGQTITINVRSTAGNTKIAQSDAIAEIEEIGTIVQANTTYSFTFKVTQMFIIMYNSATNFTGTLNAIYGITYRLSYENFKFDGTDHILQNAWVSFMFLQRYYAYDMPAYQYKINNEQMRAYGIKKLKTQSIKFPILTDPDLMKLVKTNLGNGTIEKLSINLLSRSANATLKYDTE